MLLHILIHMQFRQSTPLYAGSWTGQKEDFGGPTTGQEHWQALLLGTPHVLYGLVIAVY